MRISYWSSDVCSSDLLLVEPDREHGAHHHEAGKRRKEDIVERQLEHPRNDGEGDDKDGKAVDQARAGIHLEVGPAGSEPGESRRRRQIAPQTDRKSTRLNSSH